MQVSTAQSTWLAGQGHRLDCKPYLGAAIRARQLLAQLALRKEKLQDVTDSIYHAGRESRRWVTDPKFGVPFLSSSDILRADLSDLPLLSRQQVLDNPDFTIRKGYTLITRSGTIGRMAYARPEMDGLACSEHVMRVVPNESRIPSGYLYAYLSSRFGLPLVVSGTYGAIIQSIEPQHILDLPVPRLSPKRELAIHNTMEEAGKCRSTASGLKRKALATFQDILGLKPLLPVTEYTRPHIGSVKSTDAQDRLDSTYFIPAYADARVAFDRAAAGKPVRLDSVAEVFIPTIFKREYSSDPQFGVPYITGADVFTIRQTTELYLMRRIATDNRLTLAKGMILLQEAGQRYGLIGHAVMVGDSLDGFACTNNIVRVSPRDRRDAGFLFAVLASEYGLRLLKREAAGSSIPHLDQTRVASIALPWPKDQVRWKVAAIADEAQLNWDRATAFENESYALLEESLTRSI